MRLSLYQGKRAAKGRVTHATREMVMSSVLPKRFSQTALMASIFCLGLLLIVQDPPAAAQSGDVGTPTYERVIIQDKSCGAVVIDGQAFRVTGSTLILDVLGKETSLCDLPVPCEAGVEYRAGPGPAPVCFVIRTRRLLMGADTSGRSGGGD